MSWGSVKREFQSHTTVYFSLVLHSSKVWIPSDLCLFVSSMPIAMRFWSRFGCVGGVLFQSVKSAEQLSVTDVCGKCYEVP